MGFNGNFKIGLTLQLNYTEWYNSVEFNGEIMEQKPERDLLYTYWEDLPFATNLSAKEFASIRNTPIKEFIIEMMRKGRHDAYGSTFHENAKRHAFSIKEIHVYYLENPILGRMTVQNFHFHMKSLLDIKVVQEVTVILEDRHYVSYYGTTSKIIEDFDLNESRRIWKQVRLDPIKKMIEYRHPEIDSTELDTLMSTYLENVLDYYLRMYSWMDKNYDMFDHSNISLWQFIFIAMNFSVFNDDLQQGARKIAQLLDLDKINEYPKYSLEGQK